MTDITAINVFIEVDGLQCIALIDPEKKDLFMGMLAAFQRGESSTASLSPLPETAASHLIELRRALLDYLRDKKKGNPNV